MYCLDEEMEYEKYPAKILLYHYEGQEFIPTHWHKNFELNYLVKGKWHVQIDDKEAVVTAPGIVYVNSQELHRIYPDETEEAEKIIIVFDYFYLSRCQFDFEKKAFIIENEIHNTQQIEKLMNQVYEVQVNNIITAGRKDSSQVEEQCRDILINGIINGLIYEMLKYYVRPKKYSDRKVERRQIRFQKVCQYISTHYRENMTLDDIAQVMGITREHCAREFKVQTEKTFKDYLTKCRIMRAYPLLRDTDKSISEIAALTGFSSERAFSRGFREIFHMRPTEKRKEFKK